MKKLLTIMSVLSISTSTIPFLVVSCGVKPINNDFKDVKSLENLWNTKEAKTISMSSVVSEVKASYQETKNVKIESSETHQYNLDLNKLGKKIEQLIEYRISKSTVQNFKDKEARYIINYLGQTLGEANPNLNEGTNTCNLTNIIDYFENMKKDQNSYYNIPINFVIKIDGDNSGRENINTLDKFNGLPLFLTNKASFENDGDDGKTVKLNKKFISENPESNGNQSVTNDSFVEIGKENTLYLDDRKFWKDKFSYESQNGQFNEESYKTYLEWYIPRLVYYSLSRIIKEENYSHYIIKLYEQDGVSSFSKDNWKTYSLDQLLNYDYKYQGFDGSNISSIQGRKLDESLVNDLILDKTFEWTVLGVKINVKTSLTLDLKS
ncbi:hypothetical protein SHELI_v1c05700 [Spiroplasma helicoides]|uniref:Lipoprotein n=1 Tax=Spiroplasma helicoides TaxID=216938 RepID=A0A1B3SKR4_9MOLU|nr:hypothetical protein [Spiroplasma helicoides]AOG60521.1 hypothetical protein SHELI_v1c05700 [Spiroplasma helicoides]